MSTVVWLDLEHARLTHFSDDRMQRETLHAKRIDHHTHRLENDERDSWSMYDRLAERLRQANRILVIGPGVAKTHFVNYLHERYPALAKRVVGCESSDHPSDNQIATYAKKYFQRPVA